MAELSSIFDPLCCQEGPFVEEEEDLRTEDVGAGDSDPTELLLCLVAGERQTHNLSLSDADTYLHSARRGAVGWVLSTCWRFGFAPLTAVLAVNYLDRCFLATANGLRLHPDKPWMKQLSAVACLSLAAKVEETQVPFLLDLQLPHSPPPPGDEQAAAPAVGFVFESKTIRRMELLVLSTLGWRMNPATALGFIHCFLPHFNDSGEVLASCESILLAVLSDWRWVRFPPSVWAAAAMLHATAQHWDDMHPILSLLQPPKEEVVECRGVIMELIGGGCGVDRKRRSCCYFSDPPSPSGVINSCCFSFDSSSSSSLDSWGVWPSSVSSSPDPPPSKRPNCSVFSSD